MLFVRGHLVLLLLWPLFRLAENGAGSGTQWLALAAAGAVVVALHLVAGPNSFSSFPSMVVSALVSTTWLVVLSWFVLYLLRFIDLTLQAREHLKSPSELPPLSLDSSLQQIADRAREQVDADLVVLYPWDDDRPGPPSVIPRQKLWYPDELPDVPRGTDNPTWEVVRRYRASGEPVFLPSVNTDPSFGQRRVNDRGRTPFIVRERIVSSVGMVLARNDVDREGIVGVMWLNFRSSKTFDPTVYRLIASEASNALANARLRAVQLEAEMAAERERILSDLHNRASNALSQAIVELQKASITLEGLPGQPSVEAAQREMQRARQIVRDTGNKLFLMENQRPDATVSPKHLQSIVRKAWRDEEHSIVSKSQLRFPRWEDRSLTLDVKAAHELYLCVAEAVRNSIKYSGSDLIDVSLYLDAGDLVAEVRDYGTGFEPALATLPGGLRQMTAIAEKYSWQLAIEPQAGPGARIQWKVALGAVGKMSHDR